MTGKESNLLLVYRREVPAEGDSPQHFTYVRTKPTEDELITPVKVLRDPVTGTYTFGGQEIQLT